MAFRKYIEKKYGNKLLYDNYNHCLIIVQNNQCFTLTGVPVSVLCNGCSTRSVRSDIYGGWLKQFVYNETVTFDNSTIYIFKMLNLRREIVYIESECRNPVPTFKQKYTLVIPAKPPNYCNLIWCDQYVLTTFRALRGLPKYIKFEIIILCITANTCNFHDDQTYLI